MYAICGPFLYDGGYCRSYPQYWYDVMSTVLTVSFVAVTVPMYNYLIEFALLLLVLQHGHDAACVVGGNGALGWCPVYCFCRVDWPNYGIRRDKGLYWVA